MFTLLGPHAIILSLVWILLDIGVWTDKVHSFDCVLRKAGMHRCLQLLSTKSGQCPRISCFRHAQVPLQQVV